MNKKYLCAGLMSLCLTPNAFANIGSGFYFTLGIGGGILDVKTVENFVLNYPTLVNGTIPDAQLDDAVLDAFNNTVDYDETTASVLAGRTAVGYMWNIFQGEPKKIAGTIYTVNATFGLELGYRLFDTADDEHEEIEYDSVNDVYVSEIAKQETSNQAIDLLAVARLPFTLDGRFALLLKAGGAYNIYSVDTDVNITSSEPVPGPPTYNRSAKQTQDHDEFLPALAMGLEYMFSENFGVSGEYNAILGSNHHANSQLIIANAVARF